MVNYRKNKKLSKFDLVMLKKAVFLLAFLFTFFSYGQSFASEKQFWVTDRVGVLSNTTIYNLTQNAKAHEANTTDQFVTLIISSLDGRTIEEYGRWLGNNWGVGQKGKNNGVILLVAIEDRKVRIEVGSGLGNTLSDSMARSIIDNEIVPFFKNENMEGGIISGHEAILKALGGTYEEKTLWDKIMTFFFLPFFLIGRVFLGGDFSGGGGSFGGGGASGSW